VSIVYSTKGTGPQGLSQCYLTQPTGVPVGHTCRLVVVSNNLLVTQKIYVFCQKSKRSTEPGLPIGNPVALCSV